jgi:hypothetical protein
MIDATRTCPWGIFLFISLQQTLCRILRKNMLRLKSCQKHQNLLSRLEDKSVANCPAKFKYFSQLAGQAPWLSKEKTLFTKELREELKFLTTTLAPESQIEWSAPIALLIRREPSYTSWGDACLVGAGGFSLHLRFWWALEWPQDIQLRTLKYLRKKDPSLISINILEYGSIIMGLAAAIVSWEAMPQPKPVHPLFQIFTDNTTAESWTKRIAGLKSPQARSLARVLSHLLMFTPDLGLSTDYVKGDLNEVADYLSRLRKELGSYSPLNLSALTQRYPQLSICSRFQPSQELLSLLFSSLLNGSALIPTTRVPLGLLTREVITT